MQFHEIHPIHQQKKRKRIGRGGKKGTYSGRGLKGQNARTGTEFKPVIRELIKRYPKIRGSRSHKQGEKKTVINLDALQKHFDAGTTVTPQLLIEKSVVRVSGKGTPAIKILGKGGIKKALSIKGCSVSASAKEKIEKAGGTIE
ncbi:MAG: uL15 family ribosomal protein [Candidatus Wildermuthbacteria bacterium]|nr:uL15 family ribosomal protein [Candidatus Wildermuthbacteria bacterium]